MIEKYPSTAPTPGPLCAVEGCRSPLHPEQARPAVSGQETCTFHQGEFRKLLRLLAECWAPLEHSLTGSGVVGTTWNPRAAQLRSEIADWTGFLVRTIRAQYPLPSPEIRRWPRTETMVLPDGSKVVRRFEVIQHLEYQHWVTERRQTPDALMAMWRNYGTWLAGFPGLGAALLEDARTFNRRFDTAVKASPYQRRLIRGATCGQLLDTELMLLCAAPMFAIVDTVDDDNQDAAWRKRGILACSDRPDEHRQYQVHEWAQWIPRLNGGTHA